MEIKALANPGWKFTGWEGEIQSNAPVIKQGFFGDVVLHAKFESIELPSVMISEIHYHPSPELQGDDDIFEFLEHLSVHGDEPTNLEEVLCTDIIDNAKGDTINELGIRKFSGANIIGYKSPEGQFILNPSPEKNSRHGMVHDGHEKYSSLMGNCFGSS